MVGFFISHTMNIQISQATISLKNRSFHIPSLTIAHRDFWVVVGGNGSGKTVFSQVLAKKLPLASGHIQHTFCQIALLSFEEQQKIVERIFNDRNNDTVSPDDFGQTARQIILNHHNDQTRCAQLAEKLNIAHLLDRPFVQLSTGESRKVLLCQQLISPPDLLIMDEPFEGLDQQSVKEWLSFLTELNQSITLVLIVNRLSDMPKQATHIALLDNLHLVLQGEYKEIVQQTLFQQLIYAEKTLNVTLPSSVNAQAPLPQNQPRFVLNNVTIRYGEKTILNHLSWTVMPYQHWWIKGENGAGKSTLLSILTGDHPQSYANDVKLFGIQRGSGETIWDIKKHIGYVSSQFHLDYRVNCRVIDVIISGFFDSVGVYQSTPDALRLKAQEWLNCLNLSSLAHQPFRALSWGQQRLLLIARAMVKHPAVLILDEPLQGLDAINRKLVKSFIDLLVTNSQTQLIFVSHQDQDAPHCITHLFEFIGQRGNYHYQQTELTYA